MTISIRLKEERDKLGLSQSKAGEIASVTKQTFIQWEKGKSYPDAKQLTLLSDNGFDIIYLLTGHYSLAPMAYPVGGLNSTYEVRQELLSERELALLDDFRSLSDDEKNTVETMLHAVAKQPIKRRLKL